jgi:uncharacterized membrane protein/Mg-chelatase subunit ChlD
VNLGGFWITFDRPWYLLLLALMPVLWWLGRHSLTGLGPVRRWTALALRSVVVTMLVLALAELQWVQRDKRLTVIYLLDQSLSIPLAQREEMIDYVNRAVAQHRTGDDRAGVIVFGRDAQVEFPPLDERVQLDKRIESLLDREYTNLAGAIKLAQATFPEGTARRIVLVSDGNQNAGDALQQARLAADSGVGIDVVPVAYEVTSEVAVERVVVPSDVRKGTPFELRVVLNNTSPPDGPGGGVVKGRLIISQRTDDQPQVLSDQAIELPPGKRVFTIREQIDQANFFNYEARFVPDDPSQDRLPQNNRATAHTHVRGSGQVLLIEDQDNPGEHALLVERLRKENLEVTQRRAENAFKSLAELQPFDTVLLANVPREHFSPEQIEMLATNTHDLGAGLIMLGGPNSFGAGGWARTEVEAALPLDCEIKSAKVSPKGALALVMHASEMADGNHWQKIVCKQAIQALGSEDYCGVLSWNGNEEWLWKGGMVPVKNGRQQMLARVDRMIPGDMPDFEPGMAMALKAFTTLPDAAVKHMIVISDGDPSPPSNTLVNAFKANNITVSTVAITSHGPAASAPLEKLALDTGGKYYAVLNPRALPKIYQRESRRVARPLIYEDEKGFAPQRMATHAVLNGVGDPLPPLNGFVMTTVKPNPLVEVLIASPVPDVPENTALLATWTYGIGKSAALTTDAGARWSKQWSAWGGYDKFFSQLVRWSMRAAGDDSRFNVTTDVADGKVNVVVTALDTQDEFVNFLDVGGSVISPEMKSNNLKLKQTAPGRYAGSFEASEAGSYFVVLSPGGDRAPVRAGVNVPYSPEFRDRGPNDVLLTQLAQLEARDGPRGELMPKIGEQAKLDDLLAINTFRHTMPEASHASDIWPPILWLTGLVFLGDVFIRRVQVSFAWVPVVTKRLRDRLLSRQTVEAPAHLDRLRSRKQAVSESIAARKASTTYEPPASTDLSSSPPTELPIEGGSTPLSPSSSPAKPAPGLAPSNKPEEEDYTSRLLKAKKKVWDEREKKDS